MLKPSQISSKPAVDMRDAPEVERQFDHAIQVADKSGNWPARVEQHRDAIKPETIEAVADRYRAEGWLVTVPGGGIRALIDHPDRPR